MNKELVADPERFRLVELYPEIETGCYIRAKDPTGKWTAIDVIALSRDSVEEWLTAKQSEPGNPRAVALSLGLLGHDGTISDNALVQEVLKLDGDSALDAWLAAGGNEPFVENFVRLLLRRGNYAQEMPRHRITPRSRRP